MTDEQPIPSIPPTPIPPSGPPSSAPPAWKGALHFAFGLVATLLFNVGVVVAIIAGLGSLDFPVVVLFVVGMLGVNAVGVAVARSRRLPLAGTGILTAGILTAAVLALPLYVLWSCQSSGF